MKNRIIWLSVLLVSAANAQAPVQTYPMRALTFAAGTSSATASRNLERGASDTYTVTARAGQTAVITLTSIENNASFSIYAPSAKAVASADGSGFDIDGQKLPGGDPVKPPLDAGAQKRWAGKLPTSGRYLIEIVGDRGNAQYTLKVAIK